MSFSGISRCSSGVMPVVLAEKKSVSCDDRMSFLRQIPPFKGQVSGRLYSASSDSSLVALERDFAGSPLKSRASFIKTSPSPTPRSPSPVLLQYVAEEDRLDGSSSEHEELHALNYSRQVSVDLAEGRIVAALVKVSIISIPSVRIAVECKIFEEVLLIAEKYPKDSAKFNKYQDIAWTSLNQAFDFLKKTKAELTPTAYRELEDRLIRCAEHS